MLISHYGKGCKGAVLAAWTTTVEVQATNLISTDSKLICLAFIQLKASYHS